MIAADQASAKVLRFSDLQDWPDDDHGAALAVFVKTCDLIDSAEWQPVCALARDVQPGAARSFFEVLFRPVQIGSPPALFTGYFEPELDGSPVRTPRFAFPLYRRPPEMADDKQWLTRAEIDAAGHLQGRGLEIAWLEAPADVFFLQLQGSGRIRMPDGHVIRVGYAGKNNQPYLSIGAELIRRGIFAENTISAGSIKDWVSKNPDEGQALMRQNPSFVFFRKIADLDHDEGPIGAMARPVTPMRTIAVDPSFVPLGAPVWVEKNGLEPIRRLMVAQDTGGAIKGAQRADIYFGTGAKAGRDAGQVRDSGRMIVLVPIDRAYAMVTGG